MSFGGRESFGRAMLKRRRRRRRCCKAKIRHLFSSFSAFSFFCLLNCKKHRCIFLLLTDKVARGRRGKSVVLFFGRECRAAAVSALPSVSLLFPPLAIALPLVPVQIIQHLYIVIRITDT